MMRKERRWFVGIDWGSQEHVVSLCDDVGKRIGQRKFAHGGTGLTDMIAWLLKESGGKPGEIHVAIETPTRADCRGPARAQLQRLFDQSEAARSLSRPLHRRRSKGRQPRC